MSHQARAVICALIAFPLFASGIVMSIFENDPQQPEIRAALTSMADDFADGVRFPDDPLNDCGNPCVIVDNPGGHVIQFEFAALTIPMRAPRGVRIIGDCFSACTIFADIGRPNVCVTPNARFFFHRVSTGEEPPDSSDIFAWVRRNGGFPPYDLQKFTVMNWPETSKFWPMCAPNYQADDKALRRAIDIIRMNEE